MDRDRGNVVTRRFWHWSYDSTSSLKKGREFSKQRFYKLDQPVWTLALAPANSTSVATSDRLER